MNYVILTCKSVMFYSQTDEALFFKWIDSIPSIVDSDGRLDELYLYLNSYDIPGKDLWELLALFYRYNVDMTQLKHFLNKDNREWFYEGPKGFWFDAVFGG